MQIRMVNTSDSQEATAALRFGSNAGRDEAARSREGPRSGGQRTTGERLRFLIRGGAGRSQRRTAGR